MSTYLSANQYAAKHGGHASSIIRKVMGGRHDGTKVNNVWMILDAPTPLRAHTNWQVKKRCGMCKVIKDRWADFSPSRQGSNGTCKECNAQLGRRYRGATTMPEYISYAQELKALSEQRSTPEDMKPLRAAAIQAQAERIAAMGLAGNGKDFPNGE